VTFERTNELFGGTETVTESVPGPRWSFGYYVGLDLWFDGRVCLAIGGVLVAWQASGHVKEAAS